MYLNSLILGIIEGIKDAYSNAIASMVVRVL